MKLIQHEPCLILASVRSQHAQHISWKVWQQFPFNAYNISSWMNFTERTLNPIFSVHKSMLLLALTLDWLVGKKYEQLWRLLSMKREMEKDWKIPMPHTNLLCNGKHVYLHLILWWHFGNICMPFAVGRHQQIAIPKTLAHYHLLVFQAGASQEGQDFDFHRKVRK